MKSLDILSMVKRLSPLLVAVVMFFLTSGPVSADAEQIKTLAKKATEAFQEKDYDQSADFYNQAIDEAKKEKVSPGTIAALFHNLGVVREKQHDLDGASAAFGAAIAIRLKSVTPKGGLTEKARAEVKTVITDGEVLVNLLRKNNKTRQAFELEGQLAKLQLVLKYAAEHPATAQSTQPAVHHPNISVHVDPAELHLGGRMFKSLHGGALVFKPDGSCDIHSDYASYNGIDISILEGTWSLESVDSRNKIRVRYTWGGAAQIADYSPAKINGRLSLVAPGVKPLPELVVEH